jgi:hypothetical protein
MKNKAQIKEHLNKALELLKRQTLPSDELKARSLLAMAVAIVLEAEDEDAPKSGAV